MNLESFSPFVGERFELLLEESPSAAASILLIKAERNPNGNAETGRPFSLEFEGREEDPMVEQGTYRLRTAGFDEEFIFLVPIGPRRYQAVFN